MAPQLGNFIYPVFCFFFWGDLILEVERQLGDNTLGFISTLLSL